MRSFTLLTLAACILLPPLLYIYTVQFLENYLKVTYTETVEKSYIGDTNELFNGTVSLRSVISDNIDRFLNQRKLMVWGVRVGVVVMTRSGRIIYPAIFEAAGKGLLSADPMKTAAENYALLTDGLIVNVTVKADHNTPLTNTILAVYICMSFLSVSVYYRRTSKRAKKREADKNREIARLKGMQHTFSSRLTTLARTRETLEKKYRVAIRELEDEKRKASRNEDDLINEIVDLEEKITANQALQQEKQDEVSVLKERIKELEKDGEMIGRQLARGAATLEKRFKTLYKRVIMNKRAIKGYMTLSEDMKIKCEEVIHQLNEDPARVPVKRKVFHKKSRETVFEVIYAYRGRLYYRKTEGNHVEILSVGTKNTQLKDLGFLDGL